MNRAHPTVSGGEGWWQAFSQRVIASRFLRHVGILTGGNAVSTALGLVQGILVARWLGPELYGVAALVVSVPSVVYTIFDARSSEASVRYLSEFHAKGERERAVAICWLGYVIDLAVATVAFAGIVVLAPWASRAVIRRPETTWLVVLYGAGFLPRALVGTSYAVLASLGAFSTVAALGMAEALVRLVVVLGLILAGWGVAGVIWGNAVAMAVTGVAYTVPALRLIRRAWGALPWALTWGTLSGRQREIARFLAYNDLYALLGVIPKQLDVVLLGYFRTPSEVGYYKLAKSAAAAVGSLVGPLQSVAYPKLAQLSGLGDCVALRVRTRQLALHVGMPLGLAVVAGSVLVPFALPVLVGDAYQPATLAAQFLLVGSAIWLGFFWLRPAYFAQSRLPEWVSISTVVVALSLVVYPVVVWQWGYLGLAVCWGLLQLLGHCLAAWRIWSR